MTVSPDNANSMLQQHCNGDPVREDQKSLYTDILISRMISAANSAAALAATAKATSNIPLSASTLTSVSSTKLETSDSGTSSRSLVLTNNTKTTKKLSFSVDSLLTNKVRKSSISSEGLVKRRSTFGDKKSAHLTEEERAEEEEDLEVDGDEICDSKNGDIGEDEEEKTWLSERLFANHRIAPNFTHYATSNGDEASSARLAIPKPLIPVSHLPPMNTSPNLLAGLAQAMAVAAAANAAANSRYNALTPTVSLSEKSLFSESSTITTNSLLRTNSGLHTPYLPPGFPLGTLGSRPSFQGEYIRTHIALDIDGTYDI
jgi:hypothetical protein